jgi:hypothetical protein
LNTETNDIENEKSSLVTAMKLLQEDNDSALLNNKNMTCPKCKAQSKVHDTSVNQRQYAQMMGISK